MKGFLIVVGTLLLLAVFGVTGYAPTLIGGFIYIIFWCAKNILRGFVTGGVRLNVFAVLGVIAVFMVLFLDQLPFYWYAKYLYGRDGGVVMAKAAPEEQGYMEKGDCEYPSDKRIEFNDFCYLRLFGHVPRWRTLKFIEFELTPDMVERPSQFYERQGPGLYRIVLEKVPLEDCLLLQDLHEDIRLRRVSPKLLDLVKAQDLCPVVRKVDQPMSKYRDEFEEKEQVVFSTGIHRVIRITSRRWLSVDRKTSLIERKRAANTR